MNTSFIEFNTVFDFKEIFMENKRKGQGTEWTFSEQNNSTKNPGLFK